MVYLEKEAQRKSIKNIVKRHLNPMNVFRYLAFEDYQSMYDEITWIDNNMRDIAKGSDPDLREAIHQARMAFKNREYPKVMYYAWQLLSIMDNIFSDIPKLEILRDKIIKEFNSNTGLTPSQIEEMHKALGETPTNPLRSKVTMPIKASAIPGKKLLYTIAAPELITEAGVGQWIQENIPSIDQMKGNILERMFKNTIGKQKESAREAMRLAETTYKSIKDFFRKLDENRNDFGNYIKIAKDYQERFIDIKKQMSALYQASFAGINPTQPVIETPSNILPQQNIPPVINQPVSEVALEVTPEGTEKTVAAIEIMKLLVKSAKEQEIGNLGIASVLLVKASEICDKFGDEENSIKFLNAAQNIIGK
jgi:hypothetical protein